MGFIFEDLDTYKLALSLADRIRKIAKSFPRGEWQLADQFRRAATSMPLNIAEGAARFHRREKKQFYWIARGSCYECVAVVELCIRAGIIDADTRNELRRELERVSKMLTALVDSVDKEKK